MLQACPVAFCIAPKPTAPCIILKCVFAQTDVKLFYVG